MRSKSRLKFDILFEDKYMIVINKPAGLLTTHTKLLGRYARESQITAENLLNDYLRKGQVKSRLRVFLVHRLDRETSGVMMFAKTEEVSDYFRNNWNALTTKKYSALVEGVISDDSGIYESYLKEDDNGYKVRSVAPETKGAKKACTHWRVIERGKNSTLVEVELKSGRKNQIRVHFSEAGFPIMGDEKYGAKKNRRLFLHSEALSFVHPFTHQVMEFSAPSHFSAHKAQGLKDKFREE